MQKSRFSLVRGAASRVFLPENFVVAEPPSALFLRAPVLAEIPYLEREAGLGDLDGGTDTGKDK